MKPKTCGSCSHFIPFPREMLGQGVVLQPDEPRRGQCRAVPPQVILLGMNSQGQPVMQTDYPQVADMFPACGQFTTVSLSMPARTLSSGLNGRGPAVVAEAPEPAVEPPPAT